MAVAYGTATEATFDATTAWSINVPASTAVGDLLVCWAGQSVGTGTFAAPAGWTVGQTVEAGSDCTLGWAWKVAEAGDTSGSIAFTWDATKSGSAVLIRYTGAHATTPINAGFNLVTQASDTTWDTNAIVPTVDGCLIVASATSDGNTGYANPQYSSWTFGGSAGTQRHDFRDEFATIFEQTGVADFTQVTAASIAAQVTRGNADVGVMGIVAIAPPAAVAQGVPYRNRMIQLLSH